ncbi:MAG: CoA transferase [Gammaproteobacteria bacterium]|jgi:crotonobetainyl-CoA:carnitine CoA-transferase CaiB-like acyl-CoA transferase|nr:CoA transferase [Gammaproteobacteria bacterium]HJN94709.1 CoA transferase [Gammaproteobacteria bacterium]|tara:strand:- start:25541 stop:26725 length:1185 start_codon:yes stop_codon:yes gene_type:complete
MFAILNEIRVLDLTSVVLGPYATQILGDFGAEVIKIENLEGDMFRAVRPGRSDQMGAGFINCNRNKESLVLNLKSERGIELFYRLVKTADVVVHNMRTRTAEKLGIGYEDCKARKADIVFCNAQGFGEDGPLADVPAYDDIIQAASGLAYLNADSEGHPRYLPTIVADKVAGLQLTIAVLGGLMHKQRTGKGCAIEAPMFEGLVSFLMAEQMAGQSFVPSMGGTGYERLNASYRNPHPTADGFIALLPYSKQNWIDFFHLVGRPELAELEIVTDAVKRSENINQLYAMINEISPEKTTDEWCELLQDANIPHTRVNHLDELIDNEHLSAVGLFQSYEHPSEGSMLGVRSPYVVQGIEEVEDKPAQLLGEANAKILQELGLNEQDMQQLLADGVI